MPQRRGHGHVRPRDAARNGLANEAVPAPAIEKRGIVTVYTTLTSADWAGGDLTTLPQSESKTSTTPETTMTTDSAKKNPKGQAKENVSSVSSLAPIEASTAMTAEDMSQPLVAATSAPATSTTASSTSVSSSSATSAAASAASTSAASSSSSSSSGDVATKAGIALGVLGGLFVVLAFVYWMLVRRRKQVEAGQRKAADDEKFDSSGDDIPVSATPARAPRLSLRPMTGLFNGIHVPGQANQQTSKSIAMANAPMTKRIPGGSAWERPTTSESSSDRNPFGNGAQILEEPGTPKDTMNPMTPISEASTHVTSPESRHGLAPAPRISALTANTATTGRVSAITMDSATVPPLLTRELPRTPPRSAEVSPIESADEVPVGRAVTCEPTPFSEDSGGISPSMERQLSERRQSVRKENIPAPLDLTIPPKLAAVPPSPSGTEFSMQELEPGQSPVASTSAAAIAAAGGPANSTVHRVQLDFKPTLDDEMELQAGQLVRLLHEYDDGWALCIRLDRSQQGVVPRTCLSTRPVKPRLPPRGAPRGPPVNPQGRTRGPSVSSQRGPGPNYPPGARPMGPPVGQPYPAGPAAQRGPGLMHPMGSSMGPGPRPQSPGGSNQRPQSPNGAGWKPSPPGPSNRQQEYLPGQAY